MELRKYIDILWRRRWILAITVLVATAVVVVGLLQLTPIYTASATLRVAPRPGSAVDYGALEYAVRLKNTYADLAVSNPTLETLQQRLSPIERSTSALKQSVSVEFPTNNELMSVVVRDADPDVAAAIANVVADILIDVGQQTRVSRTFTIELIEPAVVPTQADVVGGAMVVVFAAFVSLAGGLVLALVLENIDTTIYSSAQVGELLPLPVLAGVPRIRGRKAARCYNGFSPEGEAFRHLRSRLAFAGQQTPARTIMVTSAEPGEGKSLVSANLAYSLAQLGQRVLIVDADLRLPTLHRIFGLPNQVGLGNLLGREVTLDHAVQLVEDQHVWVLTSGTSRANPADAISSDEMGLLIRQMAEQFDVVVFDTPAYLAVAESTVLSRLVDGVLLVVRCDKSQKHSVQAMHEQMRTTDVRLLGVVANAAERNRSYRYYQQH